MNFKNLFSLRSSASGEVNEPSGTANPAQWFLKLMGGQPTRSKIRVTQESSLRIAAVFRCVQILSNTLGMLPLDMYRRTDKGRELAKDHALYQLLRHSPNANTTSYRFRQSMQAHLSMRGNAFSEVVRNSEGRVTALRQMHADRVKVRMSVDGALVYDESPAQGESVTHAERNVLHVRGFSLDGLYGMNPIELAREGFGLALAAEQAGAEAFGFGAFPPGILSVKGAPNKDQRKDLRESWREQHGGNRLDIAVLGESAEYKPISMKMEDLQYIESRKFQIFEIARLFGVPPHMLYELDRATFNNHEHQGIDFLTHTMQPYFTSWEQEMHHCLLTSDEQQEYYFEFNTAALLRTDTKTRWESYKIQREMGARSINEVRRAENDPGIGPAGDTFIEPLNMRIVGSDADPRKSESEE